MATTKKEETAEVVETTEAKPRLSRLERLQQELAEAEAKARAKKEEALAKARDEVKKRADMYDKARDRYFAAVETVLELEKELGIETTEAEQDEAVSLTEQPELPLEG